MKNLDSLNDNTGQKIIIESHLVGQSPNLANAAPVVPPKNRLKKIIKLTLIILLCLLLIGGIFTVDKAVRISNKIFVGQKTTFFQKLKQVFYGTTNGQMKLLGEEEGQINILLLGIGGQGHEGPYLSDTMILAQIRPELSEVVLISIPRDYLVDLPGNLPQNKINAAFAEGYYKNRDWDEAGRFAREMVEQISGQKIPYFAVIDFAGFEKAIDHLDGIDVFVERSFTDSQFPDEKLGYLPMLTFEQGWQQMKGQRALQFARSRHGSGLEGSDFARSQRQRKVIQAFKNKTLSLNLVSDAGKLSKLLEIFADHFHTNASPGEIFRLYKIIEEKNIQSFLSISLDPETKIICPKILEENGAYVLVPCEGKTENDVKNFFKNSFSLGRLMSENSVVWLGSSTGNKEDYSNTDNQLKEVGLTVWEVGFSLDNFAKTIIYQVNPKPATAEYLKNILNAEEVALPPPGIKLDKERVDIIIILGKIIQ